jgi:two-component system LytT family response regulator
MKSVVIVDDEKLAIEELKYLLKDYDQIKIAGEAQTPESAIDLINTLQPDLIFLDVQLRNTTAFDILEQFKTNAHIIFATAHDEFAIRAFEVNALDYLLKPIHPNRLQIAINRFMKNQPAVKPSIKKYSYHDKIVINVQNGYQIIHVKDIKAITADGDYSYIITGKNKKNILIKSLKDWEAILPSENFIRIHRSCIINMAYIQRLEKWFSNTCRVFLEDIEDPFMMSQRYTVSFKKLYRP